jgi:hypothetical protein
MAAIDCKLMMRMMPCGWSGRVQSIKGVPVKTLWPLYIGVICGLGSWIFGGP